MASERFTLDRRFYSREAVDEAIEAFRDACDIRLVSDEIMLEITSDQSGLMKDEFCNYVLGLMKNNGVI